MKHIVTIADLLEIIQQYEQYLQGKLEFSSDGWPILNKEWFLNEWPDLMITYTNRNNELVADKSRTVLCFYDKDSYIYPRFVNLLEELNTYRLFLGVVAPDITVTRDMDIEMQRAIMLANQLFMAILATNGIKVILNTRCGIIKTTECFRNVPRRIMCASGFLGCKNSKSLAEAALYVNKVLSIRPDKLMIYGKQDKRVNEQLDTLGVNYRYYEDFHRLSTGRCA